MRYYRAGVAPAWRLGLRHGLFCLGCCWALMLVMFGVGIGSLAWMAALAGIMTIEKAVPGGRRLGPLVGSAMLALAALWLTQPAGCLLLSAPPPPPSFIGLLAGISYIDAPGSEEKREELGDGRLRLVAKRVVPRRENQGAIRSRPHT